MTSISHKPASQTLEYAGRAEKQVFLHELPTRLTPWEWRDLQSRLAARKFNYDILGNLPIELVPLLASYLEDIDIIALAKSEIRRIKFSVYGNPNQGQYDQTVEMLW
jgi:hypothetical protein